MEDAGVEGEGGELATDDEAATLLVRLRHAER
jgi:hypothetical protein